jgi:hypothetical protein
MPEQSDGRTIRRSDFFCCLNCGMTAELDTHGRCATCGSNAVTYPGTYPLGMRQSEAGDLERGS